MGDVLPPRRQTVVERLRRRIELYRRHHNVALPIHENTINDLNEQNRRDTLLLKQKFLEAKAKKAKKNEHRTVKEAIPDAPKNISHPKPLKVAAENSPAVTTPDVITDESANVPGPENPASDHQGHDQPVLPSFSVQIVQQFANTNSSPAQNPQAIQTNVTVKSLPPPTANCGSPASVAPPVQKDSQNPQQLHPQEQTTSTSEDTNIECKQEKEGSASDLCQSKKNSTTSSGSGGRLSDTFPSIGFAEDSSDDVIHPDLLKDLIDDVFTNSADLMKDFNFEDSVDSVKDQGEVDKDADSSLIDIVKGPSSSPPLRPFSNGNGVFDNSQSTSSHQTMELFSRESASSANTMPVLTATTTTATTPTTTGLYPPPVRLPTYNPSGTGLSISSGLGLDFKLTEPSPAALTLKQMAEQHQNMQQKHQHINMRIGSPSGGVSNRAQCNQDGFGDHLSSMRSGFMNGSNNSLGSFGKGPSHNGIFNSEAFDPPYPGVVPLRNVFKQEVCLTGMGGHLNEASVPSQQGMHISQMPGRAVSNLKSPAYGATRPLTHYPDPMEQNGISRQMVGQYNSPMQPDSRLQQMAQNHPVHIGHNTSQQLPQQVHSASPDVKQPPSSIQNNSNMYGDFSGHVTNSALYHTSMPQTPPYNSQFVGPAGLSRPPPPEYKPTQPDMVSTSMAMVDQSDDPASRGMYSSAKHSIPMHQRTPIVMMNPDRFSNMPPRPNEWRRGLMHHHQNAVRIEGYSPHPDAYTALMSESPHLSGIPRPPLHPQYRMMDGGRVPRPQMVPSSQVAAMHQRQQMTALHSPPINQTLPSNGIDLQAAPSMPVGGGVVSQAHVPSQVYGHPDISRQDGHHINLDFLDSFESIATDFLNFDHGGSGNFPLLDDVEMLSK